ncbi:MAG: nickel pincer cofactor biosynthesis protein LarB [Candidatus Nezhaarchaeota archaeon]|nr:nickel pincer cofactor biosynthesis protein LarB [Candidatus Nezhaarchaeota archaeon]
MQIRDLLRKVAEGSLDIEEAERQLKLLAVEEMSKVLKLDVGREHRKGIPEIVLAEHKSLDQLEAAIRGLLKNCGKAIASRLRSEQLKVLEALHNEGYSVRLSTSQRVAVIRSQHSSEEEKLGKVGIVAAGTADAPIANEVEMLVEELGCRAVSLYDVGIAGLHRAIDTAKKIIEEDVDVVVAIAGMEGALPSLLASLLDVPVIGLPASTGYGLGGGGVTALLSMLQSCSPGLVVVNVDNTVGAAAAAALIAKRVAKFRRVASRK